MKKILVDIYLAFNLGDDMFLDVLAKRYPDAQITIYHPGRNYNVFLENYNNVNKFPYSLLDKISRMFKVYDVLTDYNKMAREYDILLFLGGGIFREESYSDYLLDYRKNIIISFKKKCKKVYFLGCSFGPFKSEDYYNSYADLFKMSDDVCFRDSYSYELFKGHSNIRMAPDILCSYSINKIEKTNNSIGYSIINPNHKFGLAKHFEEYINYISNNIVKNLQDGLDVSLLSFCEKEGDMIAIETILKRIPVKMRQQISIVNYSGDIKSVISIISKLEYFVAGRFHAVILGFKYGSNVLPVVYSNKTRNLLDDINYDGEVIEFDKLNMIPRDNCYNTIDLKYLRNNSTLHFKMLDNELEKK